MLCVCFCFLQAEDGIRDLVRSRGLGDVYKRQDPITAIKAGGYTDLINVYMGPEGYGYQFGAQFGYLDPVSYTHLTLPTSDLV